MKLEQSLWAAVFWVVFTIHASATVHYVNLNNPSPTSPYTSWATAATNLQNAVDAANPGDQIIVTNGVYRTTGRTAPDGTPTSVVVTNALILQSVNGAVATIISGSGIMRCVYLTNGAALTGFTLTNGNAGNGGGIYCTSTNTLVSNCQLINNTASSGGGAYSGTLTNCTLSGNTCPVTGGSGGGAYGSTLNNCTLSGNITGRTYPNTTGGTTGGGAAGCILENCTLSGNTAYGAGASGGGASGSALSNCSISGSHADSYGGAAYGCNGTNCNISNNSATSGGAGVSGGTWVNCSFSGNNTSGSGGGAYYNTSLYNCTLSGNYAGYGGGANSCILINCLLTGNTAGGYGGGAEYGTLINCTVAGNTAQLTFGGYGGGVYGATLDNCIIYYNNGGSAGPNDYGCTLNYCCTATATGVGNTTNAPLFTAGYQLQSGSPCTDAGNNAYVTTTFDLAGHLRIANATVDMGAYEFQTTNPLTVSIQASLTNVPVFYPVNFTCVCSKGQSDVWNFGDGTVMSNQLSVSHTWTNVGDYPVVLTVYDVSAPGGISAALTIHVKNPLIYYVNPASTNSVAPYETWTTAATNIQSAIDAALPVPQSLVLVTNGVYQMGGETVYGYLSNRVVINKTITVQSVNGPTETVIQGNPVIGDTAVRCVYLTNNSVLNGFTLTSGATRSTGDATHENSGGAIWCESTTAVISNCVVTDNSAVAGGGGVYGGTFINCTVCSNRTAFTTGVGNGGGAASSILNNCAVYDNLAGAAGGGAYNSTLSGCSLTSNQAGVSGGGTDSSTLNSCTLTGNGSATGGGANSCTLNNCIIYYNSAPNGSNYSGGTLNYCCTQWPPGSGAGNITGEPEFTDSAHISATSPCRGAGSTNYISGVDIDGQAWLIPPSIGCDEYYGGTVTGPLKVDAQLNYTNVAAGFVVNCAGTILGYAAESVWNFGDGTTTTNQLSALHAWASNGVYSVVLTAYNDNHPTGVSATNTVQVLNHPIHYVSLSSVNPVAPYLSWATAATNIQTAVDKAFAGGTILVTNGIYRFGGRVIYGLLTNRVAVTKPLTVQSVNGPSVTKILGYQLPGVTNGDGAVRCIYMAKNTTLCGFTLSNGATRVAGDGILEQSGGGVFCESDNAVVSNCVLTANSASATGGGAYQGTFQNCILSSNFALNNCGGAFQATLINCLLSNNVALHNEGGGAGSSVLTNCTLIGNSAYYGGGADYSTLDNCLLSSNNAPGAGGGVTGGLLSGCILQYNSSWMGGGAIYATLNNCLVISNSAGYLGGGSENCALTNCTVVDNTCAGTGGGVSYSGPVDNCIIYYNTAVSGGSNSIGCDLNYCCTTPNPGGLGNSTNTPSFVDVAAGAFQLQSNSPCINSANNAYVSGTIDLAGDPRIVGGVVDMGAYEYQTPVPLTAAIQVESTNAVIGFPLTFQAITGRGNATFVAWNFGDGVVASNQLSVSHSWSSPGLYTVTLTVSNEFTPGGLSTTLTVDVVTQLVYFVDVNSTNPIPPYISWNTAASNIQDALDASVDGATILVTDGVYHAGSSLAGDGSTNRVVVVHPVTVKSVNGPTATLIDGGGAMRCIYLMSNTALTGFTITNGYSTNGAGVWCASISNVIVSDCLITSNRSEGNGGSVYQGTLQNCTVLANSGYGASLSLLTNCNVIGNIGGGAYESTLFDCSIISNSASSGGGLFASTAMNSLLTGNTADSGGGAAFGTLVNCTISGNSANGDGGLYICNANNCIIYYNTAAVNPNYEQGSASMNHCCTTPLPLAPFGSGNITNNPLFVNLAAGDFHLESNSPCVNSGNNAFVAGTADLDGRPRIVNGTVDVGAYEFQGYGYNSLITWLRQYGLPTDGSVDYSNADGDGMNNYYEWLAGTDPTNPVSVLEVLMPFWTNNPPGIVVSWQSVANRAYFLERSGYLGGQPAFLTLATNIPGQPGVTTYIDTSAVGFGPFFYRVGIQTGSNVLCTRFSRISFAWLQQYGLPTDGSVDYADLDGTGFNVYQDWIAGLNPTNSLSVLAMLPPVTTNNPAGLVVSWQSVANITYFLQSSTNLGVQPAFSTVQSNIVGQAGTTSYTDTTATNNRTYFYRVGVQ